MLVTYKYRIKDTNRKTILQRMASHTNFVWNYSNEYIKTRWKISRKYTSKFDIHPLTKGASSLLDINSQTIQAISEECVTRTKKAKKNLRFRTAKKNLGWVPFKGQTIKYCGGLSGLSIREWKCVSCGSVHDRDINSALNILRFGHETLRGLILGPKGSPHYSACALSGGGCHYCVIPCIKAASAGF